ncbi:CTAG/Pcc1 family [Sesbania bispinosa]|nr:CTAG/Pcc1 family [Sesbania bispinosa]
MAHDLTEVGSTRRCSTTSHRPLASDECTAAPFVLFRHNLCFSVSLTMSCRKNNMQLNDLEVDFGSEANASIAYATLAVDKELQPDKVKRLMTVSDGKLSVHFEAIEARFLRASFSAFVDVLTLAVKTIEEFGQGMEL